MSISSANPAQDQPRDQGGRFGTKPRTEPEVSLTLKAQAASQTFDQLEGELRRARDERDRLGLAEAFEAERLDPEWTVKLLTWEVYETGETFDVVCEDVLDSDGNVVMHFGYTAEAGRDPETPYTVWDDFKVDGPDGDTVSVGKVLEWARTQA